jgi:hypothetical protein
VIPGAYCSSVGARGKSKNGIPMVCDTKSKAGKPYVDGRAHWHAV